MRRDCSSSVLALTHVDVYANSTTGIGGGLSANFCAVNGGDFDGNVARNGGGAHLFESDVSDATFTSNFADRNGGGIDVRPHPHIGLSTVTYLFAGEMMHRDSLGVEQAIRPGEVNWMTAGRGIVHGENVATRGRVRLLKMRETMRVYGFDPTGATRAPVSATPVIAVLAFDTPSREHSTRAFSDGLSEEILYAVSRLQGLRVLGATSSFSFRGRDKTKAAKALNATHVLDGSVRRTEDRVRVSAHLAEAETGIVLWSDRYDRPLDDAFQLQEEIATEVAKALTVALGEARRARAPKLTAALSDAYFEAREQMRTGAVAQMQAAAASLERIVREAPDFARAWAGLATAKLEILRLSRADRARLVEDAREAAERALGADPSIGEAYAVLAALEGEYFGRWAEREALIEKALAVEPNNPLLLFRHGQFLVSTGRVEAGYAQQAAAFELDPLDPMFAAFHGYNVWSRRDKTDGRRILVFSQFARMLNLISEGLLAPERFVDTPIAADVLAEIVPTLAERFGHYAPEQGLRFRSSSNIEDVEGFVGAGLYASLEEIAAGWRCERRFEPKIAADERDAKYAGWKEAVGRVLSNRAI